MAHSLHHCILDPVRPHPCIDCFRRKPSALINVNAVANFRSVIAMDMQISRAEMEAALTHGPCLLWIPMRLGIAELNPSYIGLIKALLSTPLAVGLGGGRPKSSYYFFGYLGDELLYLDPHITRPAVRPEDVSTEEALNSYRGDSAKRMPITAIDPCLVACFLLRHRSDYESFIALASELRDTDGHMLISIRDSSSVNVEDRIIEDTEDDFLDIS